MSNTKKNINLIDSIAYVEMYVSNIIHSRHYMCHVLKFEYIASKIQANIHYILLSQGKINIVLVSPTDYKSSINHYITKHGDSIKKLSFWVNNVDLCYSNAIKYGAKTLQDSRIKYGIKCAVVEVFNGVEHEFLQNSETKKIPGFEYEHTSAIDLDEILIYDIDHIATCHPEHTIERWVEFYKKAFNFHENTNEDILSQESGMRIIIMESANKKIKLPLVEPTSSTSSLCPYLKYNHGAGVHHIAFATNDIITAVKHYERNTGELRKAPSEYYKYLKKIIPEYQKYIDKMSEYGILLDKDEEGILFQIFTQPVVTRPTLFWEFIERKGSKGFGTANIKALYESL